MKRQWTALVVAMVAAGSLAYAEGTPQIKFDKTVFDFGTTAMVQSVSGTFSFENAGSAVLRVGKPAPSCGCTVAGVKPETLQPGEKGTLSFTVHVGNVRGMAQKFIMVPSNDPSNHNVRLTIKVNVQHVIECAPSLISVGDIRQGAMTNFTITVKRNDGKKLNITNIQPPEKMVRVRVEPADPPADAAARLQVQIEAEGKPRRLSEPVQVFIDDGQAPAIAIPIYGRIVGDVTVTPEILAWRLNSAIRVPASELAAILVRKVTIASTKPGQALQLRNPSSTVKDLALEVVPAEESQVYYLVAKLAEIPQHSENGTVKIETNLASEPIIVVPVSINVYTNPYPR